MSETPYSAMGLAALVTAATGLVASRLPFLKRKDDVQISARAGLDAATQALLNRYEQGEISDGAMINSLRQQLEEARVKAEARLDALTDERARTAAIAWFWFNRAHRLWHELAGVIQVVTARVEADCRAAGIDPATVAVPKAPDRLPEFEDIGK